ncbi:MAG: MBL fold metallo-hydrolase [Burkholderiaceae bacterium]
MRRALRFLAAGVLLAAIVGSLLLGWSFRAASLALPEVAVPLELPSPQVPPGVGIAALPTGSIRARAMLAFRGGAIDDVRDLAATALLVRHPRGDLLVDTGFGTAFDAHFAALPALARATSTYTLQKPAAVRMRENGYDPRRLAGVLLTHAHYDHVSGVEDLPDVPVWASEAEAAFIASGDPLSELARHQTSGRLRSYRFDGGPYLGFERSFDFWGDGTVVVVPAPGHTPGSVIVFVTLGSGERYALLGDIVWQLDGLSMPAERPWLVRTLVDHDEAGVRLAIARVLALRRLDPAIHLVPSHDSRAYRDLPIFPFFAK